MKILDDLLSTLDVEAPVEDIRQGPYWTAVMTRDCGLAMSVLMPYRHQAEWPVGDAGHLTAKSASDLAQLARSGSTLEAAIGMATINSLLKIEEARCTEVNAAELLVRQGHDRNVALVGHFPFVERLRAVAGELWVLEKHPMEGDVAEDEAQTLIPRADVVAITGSAFVNHTIEGLLDLCRREALVVVLGPTTPLSPVLFDYGVDIIAGTRATDPEAVLRYASQGATFRQMKGVRLLTMSRQ